MKNLNSETGLDCSVCQQHCCGGSPVGAPILLHYEEEDFAPEDKHYADGVFRLNRDPATGLCKFFSNGRCTVYERRPEECRVYPYIYWYDTNTNTVDLVAHSDCPQVLSAVKPVMADKIKCINREWWKIFSDLSA